MQNLQPPSISLAEIAIRARICPKCYQRPVGSEELDALQARSCQQNCTIFQNLPKLTAALDVDTSRLDPDHVMLKFVCPTCHASTSAGEFCADRLARTCPLSRYAGEVLEILEDLRRVHQPGAAVRKIDRATLQLPCR